MRDRSVVAGSGDWFCCTGLKAEAVTQLFGKANPRRSIREGADFMN